MIDGDKLTPGGPDVTVSGGVVSLGATRLIVGSKTEVFSPSETSGSGGLGALIMSGLGQISGVPRLLKSHSCAVWRYPIFRSSSERPCDSFRMDLDYDDDFLGFKLGVHTRV